MFNNKLRKLVRDPKLFFSDMAANQARKLRKLHLKKKMGTIIIPWFLPCIT